MTRRLASTVFSFLLLALSGATAVAQAPDMEEQQTQQQDGRVDLPPIDRAAANTSQGKRDLAIVVAVENYHSLSGIPGAVMTGMDWKVFFSQHLGMPDDRILFLKDHKVTPGKLKREIPTFLKKADKNARVWFVFIGHGAPYQGVDGDSQISDGLLVGVGAFNDTYADFVEGSLRKTHLEQMLAAGKQKQTITVIDACFSGKTPYNQNLTGTMAVIPSKVIAKVGPKDVTFSAAAHNEVANLVPGNTAKRPAFSYVLLGALRGWADYNGDDKVNVAEAEMYTQRALLGLQTPSATVGDAKVRDESLVDKAPEKDPGASNLFRPAINRGKSYANKPCDTAGKVRNADTQGECCWPGQAYSSMAGTCVGSPMCPDGMALGGDGECAKESGEKGYARALDRGQCTTPARCQQLADDAYYGRSGPRDDAKAAKFYAKACELGAGGLRACAQLGFMIQYGLGGLEKDEAKPLELYTRSCTGEVAWGCAGLGYYYNEGLGGLSKNESKALSLYKKACDQGSLRGCSNLGVMYKNARGVARDYDKARALYEKACEGGHANGCSNLGNMYDNAEGVARDYDKARALYEKACEGGDSRGCSNLGVMYDNAEGVARDYDKARSLYTKACEGGYARGCSNLGVMYKNARGVARDYDTARALYEKACEGGHANGCSNLGYMYDNAEGVARDYDKARALYEKACEGGDANGCTNLGYMYKNAEGVARDYDKARALYEKACEGGDARGCSNLGYMYDFAKGVARDYDKARALYEKACEGGDSRGCSNLGVMYDNAEGVARDYDKARSLYTKACEGGDANGCYNLAILYKNGRGVARDLDQARRLFQKICDQGDEGGCQQARALSP